MKPGKYRIGAFAAGVACLGGLFLLSASRGQQARLEPEKPKTEKEKIEGRILYQRYDREFGVRLSDYAPNQPSVEIERFPHVAGLPPDQRPADFDCIPIRSADVILLVQSRSASSHLTPNGNFIFTTHEMEVKEVIKGLRPSQLRPGDLILVSLPGGKLLIDNRPVSVIEHGYIQLVAGHQYVLFLKLVPETGDFTSLKAPDPSFDASDARLAQIRQLVATCQNGVPHAN